MKGITLVEVLVSVAIIGFLAVGIYQVMDIGNSTYLFNTENLGLQQEARRAMDFMVDELRGAKNVKVTVINTDRDQINFDTLSALNVTYYIDTSDANHDSRTDQVLREYPSGTWKILGNYISRLKFTLSGKFLNIEIRSTKTISRRQQNFSLIERLTLRN